MSNQDNRGNELPSFESTLLTYKVKGLESYTSVPERIAELQVWRDKAKAELRACDSRRIDLQDWVVSCDSLLRHLRDLGHLCYLAKDFKELP